MPLPLKNQGKKNTLEIVSCQTVLPDISEEEIGRHS